MVGRGPHDGGLLYDGKAMVSPHSGAHYHSRFDEVSGPSSQEWRGGSVHPHVYDYPEQMHGGQ
eukprot:5847226-Amphidinium_carterae.1